MSEKQTDFAAWWDANVDSFDSDRAMAEAAWAAAKKAEREKIVTYLRIQARLLEDVTTDEIKASVRAAKAIADQIAAGEHEELDS